MWLNRAEVTLVNLSPAADMAKRYPADAPFVGGDGNAISNAAWLWDPDLTAVGGVPEKYWVLTGDVVSEMDQASKDAVDAAIAAAKVLTNQNAAIAACDDVETELGWETRAHILFTNKQRSWAVNRLQEITDTLIAIKATQGNVQSIRDAIPASFLATQTRPLAVAIQDYKDDLAAGEVDTSG
jgi:hypothetical protein